MTINYYIFIGTEEQFLNSPFDFDNGTLLYRLDVSAENLLLEIDCFVLHPSVFSYGT